MYTLLVALLNETGIFHLHCFGVSQNLSDILINSYASILRGTETYRFMSSGLLGRIDW